MAHNSFTKAFRRLSPPGYDLWRLRGLVVVVACAAAIFATMHFVLGFALGWDASAIYPRQRPLGLPMYRNIWGRVAAVDRLYQTGQLPRDARLGVYIGVSTTATGIQRQFLDARANVADRWIVLAGAGLSFENIESVMHPVFFCSQKPAAVVFGVHPQMLVGERYVRDESSGELHRVVGRRRRALESHFAGYRALSWLKRHWAIDHRALAADFLRSRIYLLRLWFLYLGGVSADRLFEPSAQPWDEEPLWLWNMDDAENKVAQNQLDFWAGRGHFDAANYRADGDQARSLIRMIRAYRKLGAKVYVVIMPLRSTVRRKIPPNAKPCLFEAIDRAFPEAPPTIVDLQEAMPDKFFTDEAHLSKAGSERLSKQVAERLRTKDASSSAPDGS